MSRRYHKKSKNGCLECKRRHMRCDENQPICANCSAAEMRCSFLSRDSPYIVQAFPRSHSHVAPSPVSTTASTPVPSPWPEHTMSNQEPPDPFRVNMTHIELFNNLSSEELLSLDESGQQEGIPTTMYTKHALTIPYLMHQILASSALHLSTKTAESREFYREYAIGLQHRALSLFKESNPVLEVTPENCVHMFLFSSLVGVHLLCDTLHYQRDSLEGFIDKFTYSLIVYRGVLAITEQCEHLLRESELGPHLKVLIEPTDGSGSECDTLRDLVNAADLTPYSRKAYLESILHLQRVFDTQRQVPGNKTRIPVVLAWPILVSPEYVDLLRQRQAEALVILAHYALLLHRGRDLWLIGNGGQFLIESICGSLGPNWQEWLKVPKAALRENSTA